MIEWLKGYFFLIRQYRKQKRFKKYVENLPDYLPTPQEIAKQMRINVDILKFEITEHIDREIERFRKEVEKFKY